MGGGMGGGMGAPGMSADPASLKTPRDGDGLLRMLENLTGGDPDMELPLAALQEVTKHVATFSRKNAPKLIQQKRAFVRGWHEEQRRLRGHSSGRSGATPTGAGELMSPSKVALLANLTPDGVFSEVDARLAQAQRSITQSELSIVHVDALSEQIASLMGIAVPTMNRDRRDLILKWHSQQKRQRAGGGPQGRPMPPGMRRMRSE